jgi:hypothetical protein
MPFGVAESFMRVSSMMSLPPTSHEHLLLYNKSSTPTREIHNIDFEEILLELGWIRSNESSKFFKLDIDLSTHVIKGIVLYWKHAWFRVHPIINSHDCYLCCYLFLFLMKLISHRLKLFSLFLKFVFKGEIINICIAQMHSIFS